MKLYKEKGKFAGQNIGLHMTGDIMLPITKERFDLLKCTLAKDKSAAKTFVPEYTANDDNSWSNDLLTKILTARHQKFLIFNADASRTRR